MKPLTDKEIRVRAIERLAIATRDKLEPQTFAVYLDDTSRVSTPVLIEACHRLEKSSTWFPKVSELLAECNLVAGEHRRREEEKRPRLSAAKYESTPEKAETFKKQWQAICQGKRMPGSPEAK